MLNSILTSFPSNSIIWRAYDKFPIKRVAITGTVGAVAYVVITGNGEKMANAALDCGRAVFKSVVKKGIATAVLTVLAESLINSRQNSDEPNNTGSLAGWTSDSDTASLTDEED